MNLEFYTSLTFSGMGKDRIVKFYAQTGPRSACHKLSARWAWSRSRDIFILWQVILVSWKRCKTQTYLQWKIGN